MQINPDSARIHANLAEAFLSEQRFEDAIRHAGEALRIDPQLAHVYFKLGDAFNSCAKG